MTRNELVDNLNFLNSNPAELSLEVYFLISTESEQIIRLVDLEDSLRDDMQNKFVNYFRNKIFNNEELTVNEISTSDNRRNVIFHYDLESFPEILTILNNFTPDNSYDTFKFDNDGLNNIRGFLFIIKNNNKYVSFFKMYYHINLIKRSKGYLILKSNTRFALLDHDILNINDSIDFFKVNDQIFIIGIKTFESKFGFDTIIKNEALNNIKMIKETELLDNIEDLVAFSDTLKYAKKIMAIKRDSPALRIPKTQILEFIRNHPTLRKSIKINSENNKIKLETRISKEDFIKLLNDDFLKSELTKMNYESQNKDKLIIEAEV